MKQLAHLIKHDFLLLQRYKMIAVSVIVTVLYMLAFKGISSWGDIDKLLVLVIFNDPALLGFLFIGVIVLFEKNENTIQALAVSPIKISNYILSKSLTLTFISVICCFAMAFAGKGFDFSFIHFFFATVLTTLIFSFLGFIVVSGLGNFNKYIIRALAVILILTIPFIGYFEIVSKYWFILFPTMSVIDLFSLAFPNSLTVFETILTYFLSVIWCVFTYLWSVKSITKNFAKQ
jgi:fluoroquinolone transport system permease protein